MFSLKQVVDALRDIFLVVFDAYVKRDIETSVIYSLALVLVYILNIAVFHQRCLAFD